MNLIDKVNEQLKHINKITKEYEQITLQEDCTVVCVINGIKYSYNLKKGSVVPNTRFEDIAKILYTFEKIDHLYKNGKIKLDDIKE